MHTLDHLNAALAGAYAIERELGRGGMATVYLARDLKHDRQVAIKVLDPELGAVLGAERFLSEIKVTANLQHPNLLPLFDSGAADGLLYYVMPYVDGETLRHRLEREKQLPIDEAVRIASAIASGLEYAHRKGVIHRDLKPENILLHDGQPLVADFGIALALSNAGGNRITQTGLSLGTPQYMSPEQATGDRVVDARSDIYSLGAVLYEMLTGDPPHTGSSSQAVIARVLTETPRPVRATRANVPPHVEAAIDCALEKLAADRFASAREFSEALTGARPFVATTTKQIEKEARQSSRRRAVIAASGWAAAIIAIGVALWFRPSPGPPPVPVRFLLDLPDSEGLTGGPNGIPVDVSRDGSLLAVNTVLHGKSGISIRRMVDPSWQRVRGTEGGDGPRLSPDGKWLLFRVGVRLMKVPTAGGAPQTLRDTARSYSWGESANGSDFILYAARDGLWRMNPDGTDRRAIVGAKSTAGLRLSHLSVLPDGSHALVDYVAVGAIADSTQVGVIDLESGKLKPLGLRGATPHFVPPNRLIFVQLEGAAASVAFSPRSLTVSGRPEVIVDRISTLDQGGGRLAVSANGTLAYIGDRDEGAYALEVVDRTGKSRELPFPQAAYQRAKVSPDGKRAVIGIGRVGGSGETHGDLWIFDLTSGARDPLTTGGSGVRGEWSRDGSHIIYVGFRPPDSTFVASVPVDRTEPPTLVSAGTQLPLFEVSPGLPHGYLALRMNGGGIMGDIYVAHVDSLPAARPLIATAALETNPEVSPDGTMIAYISTESGNRAVYVENFPRPGGRIPVSIGGGGQPRWSADGKTLFYVTARHLMAAGIARQPSLTVTRRDTLFAWEGFDGFDPFPNGREFLVVRRVAVPREPLNLIFNWPQLPRTGATSKEK